MPSAHGDPQTPNRDRERQQRTAKIFPGFLVAGVILLLLALLMLVYVIGYQPGREKLEFQGRIDHPSTPSTQSPSPNVRAPLPKETSGSQQHHSTPKTRVFHHVGLHQTFPDRTFQAQRQPDSSAQPHLLPTTPYSPNALSLQPIHLSAQEPSVTPTPMSTVTRCVAPTTKTVTPSKKPNFFKRLWHLCKRLFGGEQPKPPPPNGPPIICSVNASSSLLTLPCAEGMTSEGCRSSASYTVLLNAVSADGDNDTLLHTWTVTGGKLTGEGKAVTWDLSGVNPGAYTATVEVNDGHSHTVSSSTAVTVAVCRGCVRQPLPCPGLAVSCPSDVGQGSLITFTTSEGDGNVTYNWTVSAGTIISGQGTSSISVDTEGLGGQTVTATVELGGLDPSCQRTASCSAAIHAYSNSRAEKFDQYGEINFDDERAHLDNFAMQLQTEPASTGAIIVYGSCEGEGLRHGDRARQYLVNSRGIDPGRVRVIDGGCRDALVTELWEVPAGRMLPTGNLEGAISPCPACKMRGAPRRAAATLSGVVQNPDGKAIAGAKVVLYGEDGSSLKFTTDQNGNFAFNDLEAGTYKLEIKASGFGELTDENVVVREGPNFLRPELTRVSLTPRTITLKEQDLIRVEYPDHFLKDAPGEVEFTLDRQLGDVVPSETNSNGKVDIIEKAPPVPGASPGVPYYQAYKQVHGPQYTAYATIRLIPMGLTQVEGPEIPEQSLDKAPVSWKWKLKPANDAGKVASFRFHVDIVWRAPGLPNMPPYSYDWPKTFSVPIGPPASVAAATYGYQGFGAGGFGMLGAGLVKRRRRSGKPEESDAPDTPLADTPLDEVADEVSSSVFAPREAAPGDAFLVQVFAHLAGESPDSLKEKATAADPATEGRGEEPFEEPIKRGAVLTFRLSMEGLEIDEPQQKRTWKGQTIRVQFGVNVPKDAEPRAMFGKMVVYEDSLPVGHFRFAFKIVGSDSEKTGVPVSLDTISRYRQAFISYAHQDRAEVLKRVQMLNILRQKYFQDFINLKSGDKWEPKLFEYLDNSDVVYLFWSIAASKSEFVKQEILRAVKRHGGNEDAPPAIYPVIIEGPPPAPPPDELSFLQFDDEFSYKIFAAEATSKH